MSKIAVAAESESKELVETRESPNDMLAGDLAGLQLSPDPIYEKWILSGKPVARSKILACSPDGGSTSVLWDCTSGSFYWHYRQDESVLFLSGDAYLMEENGTEHRFAAGDFAFFPAGTVAKWRVDHYVRKIAFLREPMWRFVVPAFTFWNKLMRNLGISRRTRWSRIPLQG
jgi:uncharacterized protein